MRFWRAIAVGAMLAASPPAHAASVSAQNPESLAEALRGAGYTVVAATDDTGAATSTGV